MKKKSLPRSLESQRLMFQTFDRRYAELLFETLKSHRKVLEPFLRFTDSAKSRKGVAGYIRRLTTEQKKLNGFHYAVHLKESQEFIGYLCIHSIRWADSCCELGYWLSPEFHGQGYMSEAVECLKALCFDKGFNRVEIRCDPRNIQSIAVATRCGFSLEGWLQKNILFRGKFVDTLVFAANTLGRQRLRTKIKSGLKQ